MRTAADKLDVALDAALNMTFPASDPISLFTSEPGGGAVAPDRGSFELNQGQTPR